MEAEKKSVAKAKAKHCAIESLAKKFMFTSVAALLALIGFGYTLLGVLSHFDELLNEDLGGFGGLVLEAFFALLLHKIFNRY